MLTLSISRSGFFAGLDSSDKEALVWSGDFLDDLVSAKRKGRFIHAK